MIFDKRKVENNVIDYQSIVPTLPGPTPILVTFCPGDALMLPKNVAVLLIFFAKFIRPVENEVTFSVFESSCHPLLPI